MLHVKVIEIKKRKIDVQKAIQYVSSPTKLMFKIIRKTIDKILIDRPIENDIETTAVELEEFIKSKKLKKFWIFN